jgi:hypothetical protein
MEEILVRCIKIAKKDRRFTKGKIYKVTKKGFKNEEGYTYTGYLKGHNTTRLYKNWYNWVNRVDDVKFERVSFLVRRF